MSKPTIETLLTFCVRAYQLGAADVGKRRTQLELFDEVRFSMRGGYRQAVWEAYKAGRFATKMDDK